MYIENRSIVKCILLSIITCGIYGIIWFINLTDDVARASGDNSISGGKAFLFGILTCGIYYYYWAYKMGKLLQVAKAKNGKNADDNSILYLILQVFGLGIVNYCLVQNELNSMSGNNGGGVVQAQYQQPMNGQPTDQSNVQQ